MGCYVFKAYPLPGKEEDLKQLLSHDHASIFSEQVGDRTLLVGETDDPLGVMRRAKPVVSYMWAYNPYSWDEDQGDYMDRVTMEVQSEIGNL